MLFLFPLPLFQVGHCQHSFWCPTQPVSKELSLRTTSQRCGDFAAAVRRFMGKGMQRTFATFAMFFLLSWLDNIFYHIPIDMQEYVPLRMDNMIFQELQDIPIDCTHHSSLVDPRDDLNLTQPTSCVQWFSTKNSDVFSI